MHGRRRGWDTTIIVGRRRWRKGGGRAEGGGGIIGHSLTVGAAPGIVESDDGLRGRRSEVEGVGDTARARSAGVVVLRGPSAPKEAVAASELIRFRHSRHRHRTGVWGGRGVGGRRRRRRRQRRSRRADRAHQSRGDGGGGAIDVVVVPLPPLLHTLDHENDNPGRQPGAVQAPHAR